MHCKKCGKNIDIKDNFCNKCFINVVERRIKKTIRKAKLKRNQKIMIKDKIAKKIFTNIITMPLKITTKGKFNKKILPYTRDYHLANHLKAIFANKKPKKREKNTLYLFESLTTEELERYLNLKHLKLKKEKNDVLFFLNEMEKKYPSTKHAMAKALEKLHWK